MVGERLLVGWGLAEEPLVLPVISALELEPRMGLSPLGESHRIPFAVGLIVVLDCRVAFRR